jgi:hypothetical protein
VENQQKLKLKTSMHPKRFQHTPSSRGVSRGASIAALFFLATIAGCGDGTIQIQDRSDAEVRIAPHRLIQRLEQSTDAPRRTEILNGLRRQDAHRFNWPLFWEALAERPFAKDFYQTHFSELQTLAVLHCDSYSEYTHFLLSVDADIASLFSQERICNTRLNPAAAVQVTLHWLQGGDEQKAIDALRFLSSEAMAGGDVGAWTPELEKAGPQLEALSLQLMASPNPGAYFDSMLAMREKFKANAYPRSFLPTLTTNAQYLKNWFAHFSGTKALQHLAALIEDNPSFQPTPTGLQNLLAAFEASLLTTEPAAISTAVNETLKLSLHWVRSANLRTQLASMDRMLRSSEQAMARLDADGRGALLHEWLGYQRQEPHYAYLQWLALRHDSGGVKFAENVREFLAHSAEATQPNGTLMHLLLTAFVAQSTEARSRAIAKACDFLAQASFGIPSLAIGSTAELKTLLENHLEAGCHTLPSGSTVEVVSDKTLSTSFAAILQGQDQSVQFRSAKVSLGPVSLKRTIQASPVPAQAPNPKANALVIPVFFGARVKFSNSAIFAKGSHLFMYHYTFRAAEAGTLHPMQAAAGTDGGHVTIQAQSSLEFPFASVGALGQIGAPVSAGGDGDTSSVDFTNIANWATDLISAGQVAILLPAKLHSSLSLEAAADLLAHAVHDTDGNVELFTVPGYLNQMSEAALAKVVVACREILAIDALSPAQVSQCFHKNIASLALGQLSKMIENSTLDPGVNTTAPHPALNAEIPFTVAQGNPGPTNPDGPAGKSGQVNRIPY